jgi:predicted SnoaL-like aldol condensation-catalyzing enzyme
MPHSDNRSTVIAYFRDVVDGRSSELESYFADDCLIHRCDLPAPIAGVEQLRRFFMIARANLRWTETEILRLVADGDFVAAHVRHRAMFAGPIRTPAGGFFDAEDRVAQWTAQALFRCVDGRIAEEWVHRDELGILRSVGALDAGAGA